MSSPLPQEHVDQLATLLRNDQLVLFVGAGISRQATTLDGSKLQMPLWRDLAGAVAKECGENLDHYKGDILDMFDAIAANGSRGDLEEAVRHSISDHLFQPSKAHAALAKLPWHIICTTNYDDLLIRALQEANPIDQEHKYEWLSREQKMRPRLIHMHGTLANPHTLTGTDYVDWGSQNPRGWQQLEYLALQKTILFVGYSFSDPHLKNGLLPWIQRISNGRGKRHFAWMWDVSPQQAMLLDKREHITALPINSDADWEAAFAQLGSAIARLPGMSAPVGSRKFRRSGKITVDQDHAVVNGYKFFFHRTKKQRTIRWLSEQTGINGQIINNLEHVKKRTVAGPNCFKTINRSDLARLERALDCIGKLEYGQGDDFLALYLMYYKVNKTPIRGTGTTTPLDFAPDTKAVVFDFGGTLTQTAGTMSTWEKMWDIVGYRNNEAGDYHRKFLSEIISHQEWCNVTAEKLRAAGFTRAHLERVAQTIKPIQGISETMQILRNSGIEIYIVSGSVREIIHNVIGTDARHFSEIKANEAQFDSDGLISGVRGSKFDFEGKAKYIERIISDLGCMPMEVLFVGNSFNDIWASKSGARTLCVNPTEVDFRNTMIWTDFIQKMDDLRAILPFAKRVL